MTLTNQAYLHFSIKETWRKRRVFSVLNLYLFFLNILSPILKGTFSFSNNNAKKVTADYIVSY